MKSEENLKSIIATSSRMISNSVALFWSYSLMSEETFSLIVISYVASY